MIPGKARILVCPFCGEKKEVLSFSSRSFFGIMWSDGKYDIPFDISYVQRCPSCGKYYIMERQEEVKYSKYESMKDGYLIYPKMKEAFVQLSEEGFLNKKEETTVRMMLHHAYNDYYYCGQVPYGPLGIMRRTRVTPDKIRKKEAINEEDKKLFHDNGIWLIENYITNSVLKAEFYREIGEYQAAYDILESLKGDDSLKCVIPKIREKLDNNDCKVFEVEGDKISFYHPDFQVIDPEKYDEINDDLIMEKNEMKKVNYAEYEGKYDENFKKRMEENLESIDVETMRANLYGYTFTEGYANMEIPDELSMDYWKERKQEDKLKGQNKENIWNKKISYMNPSSEEGEIEDDFDVLTSPYYFRITPQERLILEAIDSTGDGETPETALCVISVEQEWEYIERVNRFRFMDFAGQELENGIDCLVLKDFLGNTEKVYFDIRRRFEVGYYKHLLDNIDTDIKEIE